MTFQGKIRKRSYNQVKSFWDKESKRIGNSPYATIRDHYFRYIEINEIVNFFKRKKIKKLLDIGCGNGFSTYFDIFYKNKTYIKYI